MSEHDTIIVGGGISGLLAAKSALDHGQENVQVFEASNRFGGKIASSRIGNETVNLGAEFIDEENTKLRALADELGVKLIPTEEQSKEYFQAPSGEVIQNFHEQYAPIARKVIEIREAAERNPKLAEQMESMTAKDLIQQIRDDVSVNENPGIFRRIYNAITFNDNKVPQKIADTALGAMEQELGAKADNISAAQFMSETSPSDDRFLASTCDYRVEGGTASLTDALKQHLEARGVTFQTGHTLEAVVKDQANPKQLTFNTAEGRKTVTADNVVMALPAYALPKIKGLESLGLDKNPAQYTKNAKITVKVKPGVTLPTSEGNAFLANSEVWSPQPGLLTFLVHNENGQAPAIVMKKAMEGYAKAFGMEAKDLFYIENGKPAPDTFAYTNPGDAPCWATPSPHNAKEMKQVFDKMDRMADDGIGFVGTYIPLPDGGVGFMECGAESVERMSEHMYSRTPEGHGKQVTKLQERNHTVSRNEQPTVPSDIMQHYDDNHSPQTQSFAARIAREKQQGGKSIV